MKMSFYGFFVILLGSISGLKGSTLEPRIYLDQKSLILTIQNVSEEAIEVDDLFRFGGPPSLNNCRLRIESNRGVIFTLAVKINSATAARDRLKLDPGKLFGGIYSFTRLKEMYGLVEGEYKVSFIYKYRENSDAFLFERESNSVFLRID